MKIVKPFFVSMVLSLALAKAQAGLFDDDEARKAILDLRQQFAAMMATQNALKAALENSQQMAMDERAQQRQSMLELQNQIDKQNAEIAKLRGENEQVKRSVSDLQQAATDLQKRQTALVQTTEQRLSNIEPVMVQLDGREFMADPAEKREYEAAFEAFRTGEHVKAQKSMSDFLQRYPNSQFKPSALFWLGSAQYSTRSYVDAIANFRALLSLSPTHLRAPDAMLSIAHCQIEMKDARSAKVSLTELLKRYPGSEAAKTGAERLAQLK